MFNTTAKIILAATFVLGGITMATAQIEPNTELKTNVPFSFIVDGKTFAAGDYTFSRVDNTGVDSSQLIMRSEKGDAIILDTMTASSMTASANTHLVFEKVGGEYFLSQIWDKGTTEGNQLINSRAENKAIAEAAGPGAADSSTSVDSN